MKSFYKHIISIKPEKGLALWNPFLLNEILLARSLSNTPFYLISPWINNFALDLKGRRGIPELGVEAGKFNLSTFCEGYLRAGGHLRLMAQFPDQSDRRGHNFKETIRFLHRFYNHPSGRVEIRLHRKVHVKLYVGLGGVLSGSPNATSGGLYYNVENLDYFADDDVILEKRRNVEQLWNDMEMIVPWERVWE